MLILKQCDAYTSYIDLHQKLESSLKLKNIILKSITYIVATVDWE